MSVSVNTPQLHKDLQEDYTQFPSASIHTGLNGSVCCLNRNVCVLVLMSLWGPMSHLGTKKSGPHKVNQYKSKECP